MIVPLMQDSWSKRGKTNQLVFLRFVRMTTVHGLRLTSRDTFKFNRFHNSKCVAQLCQLINWFSSNQSSALVSIILVYFHGRCSCCVLFHVIAKMRSVSVHSGTRSTLLASLSLLLFFCSSVKVHSSSQVLNQHDQFRKLFRFYTSWRRLVSTCLPSSCSGVWDPQSVTKPSNLRCCWRCNTFGWNWDLRFVLVLAPNNIACSCVSQPIRQIIRREIVTLNLNFHWNSQIHGDRS